VKQLNAASFWVVLIAIGVVLPAVTFLWLHLASPADGARLEPGLAVWRPDGVILTPLRTQANGLRPGDVLVAVNGTSVESWASRLFDLYVPRTLTTFGAVMRNEVDLDDLSRQLVAVVQETMQPTQVSLWLPQSERKTTETNLNRRDNNDGR